MADAHNFQELLNAAPLADENLHLTGTIARLADAAKFRLTLGDGRSVELNVDAVKSHKVVAHSVGQPIVQVDVDPKTVPRELLQSSVPQLGVAAVGTGEGDPVKIAWMDWHPPTGHTDNPPKGGSDGSGTGQHDQPKTPAMDSHPPKHPGFDTGGLGDSGIVRDLIQPFGAIPFGLATSHQSAEAAALAMQGFNMHPAWKSPYYDI